MTETRRTLVALLLLIAMPLRVMAAVAMPCCPPDPPHHAQAMGEHAAMAMDHDDDAAPDRPDDAHRHVAPVACCAVAMIASSPMAFVPHAMLPTASPSRLESVAPFLTDAPERPPRPPRLAA